MSDSIFEFAAQFGIESPFQTNENQQTSFYNGPILYQQLINEIKENNKFYFDYKNYVSGIPETEVISIDGIRVNTGRFEDEPLFIKDKEGISRLVEIKGRLNTKEGKLDIRQNKVLLGFKLDITKKEAYYNTKIKYGFNNDLALELTTFSYNDFSLLSDYIEIKQTSQQEALITKVFVDAFRKVDNDAERLKWLYEQAPQFVTKQLGDDRLLKDIKLLISYDQEGAFSWFKDSSSAIINLLTSFSNAQVLYDHFIKFPQVAIDIYRGLQGEAVQQFTSLLTSLTHLFSDEGVDFSNKVKFVVGKNYSLNSNIFIPDNAKRILLENYNKVSDGELELPTNNPGITRKIPTFKNVKIEQQTVFHPLDIVYLQDEESGDAYPVCALQVKYLSDTNEWDDVITATVVIVNIIGIIVSAGLLSAGATGVTAVIAAADVVISTIDIALIVRRSQLRGTEEGDWLDKNWDAISVSFAALSIGTALRQGLLNNGPKILSKLKRVQVNGVEVVKERIRLLLFQATFNIEIANFGETTFKIVSFNEIRSLVRKIAINEKKLDRLWKLGAVLLRGQGDVDDYFGVFYKGQRIISARSKEIKTIFKEKVFTHGVKDADIVKYFDELSIVNKARDKAISFINNIIKTKTPIRNIFLSEVVEIIANITLQSKRVSKAINDRKIARKIVPDDFFETIFNISGTGSSENVLAFTYKETIYFRESTSVKAYFKEIVHEGTHILDDLVKLEDDIVTLKKITNSIVHEGEELSKYTNGLTSGQLIELRARIYERNFEIALGLEKDFETVKELIKFIKQKY